MKLLKFGDTTINIELAIRIDDSGDYISVDFVPHDNLSLPLNIRFTGREAVALRSWIAANAEDMSEHNLDNTGDRLDEPKPYVSPR
jgi:hypothetical protein